MLTKHAASITSIHSPAALVSAILRGSLQLAFGAATQSVKLYFD
jgi:hypothetical protein